MSLTKWVAVKAFVMCVSFANLAFLTVWTDLLDRKSDLLRRYAVTWQQMAAVTLDGLLLAVVLWIPVCLVAKSGNRTLVRILKWCVLAGLILPLNILRLSPEVASFKSLPALQAAPVRALLVMLLVSLGILLLWKWESLSIALFVIFSPMLPLVVASVAWGVYTGPPAGRLLDKPPVSALPQKAGAPHVLWFIFDEWDEGLTLRRRPATLKLPELDRFRGQSFHAERAYPPNRDTIVSIPSLLTGKTFIAAEPNGASELLLTYDRHKPATVLTAESTIFSEARSGGFNVGIVGFYLAYCRMFDTTTCEWSSAAGFLPVEWEFPFSVGHLMVLTARRQVSNVPLARRLGVVRVLGEGPRLKPSLHAASYRRTHEAALNSIVDSRLNLVFVHWNVPHLPAIYDAAKDDFSNGPNNTYLDNLRLVDQTMRDIRLTLEKAGAWDSSTILMTSDHPLRLNNWSRATLGPPQADTYTQASEVPFLLKLAGQNQGFAYNAAMQTVVTKDLLLAIMRGEITQAEQVAAWLDRNPPRR